MGDSAGLESFLSALRLPLVYLLLCLGDLGGILAGVEGECGIRQLRRRVRFMLFLHLGASGCTWGQVRGQVWNATHYLSDLFVFSRPPSVCWGAVSLFSSVSDDDERR